MYQYCFSSAGRGNGSTAIELRSADFSPPRSGPAKPAGSGLKSALLSCRNSLNSMAVGNGRGAMPFLMSFALQPEIVTLAWVDNASVRFPLNIYATKWFIRQLLGNACLSLESLDRSRCLVSYPSVPFLSL